VDGAYMLQTSVESLDKKIKEAAEITIDYGACFGGHVDQNIVASPLFRKPEVYAC
jgi:hypothetical protein